MLAELQTRRIVYLDDGANRDGTHSHCWFRGDLSASEFWFLVRSGDRTLKGQWQNQLVAPMARFVSSMTGWAASQGSSSRLRFVVVPILEHGNSGSNVAGAAYQKIFDWTKPVQPALATVCRES
jgi:hypothetical protein